MGNTEQEQAEAMKRYIRKVFIPIYANNFNKELTASDIKFYGKIHFDRSRSDNELNTDRKTDRDNDTYIPKIQSGRQESNISPCSLTTFVLSGIDLLSNPNISEEQKSKLKKKKRRKL